MQKASLEIRKWFIYALYLFLFIREGIQQNSQIQQLFSERALAWLSLAGLVALGIRALMDGTAFRGAEGKIGGKSLVQNIDATNVQVGSAQPSNSSVDLPSDNKEVHSSEVGE